MRDMGLQKKNWGFFHVTQRLVHVSVKNDNLYSYLVNNIYLRTKPKITLLQSPTYKIIHIYECMMIAEFAKQGSSLLMFSVSNTGDKLSSLLRA